MDIPNQLPGTIEALGFPDLVRACHLPQTYAMPDAGHSPDFRRNLKHRANSTLSFAFEESFRRCFQHRSSR